MYVNTKYLTPRAEVARLLPTNITTVSVEGGWKDEWDEELDNDTAEASDQA